MKLRRFRDWNMLLKIMTIPSIIIICVFMVIIFYFLPFIENKLMKEKEIATRNVVEVVFMIISEYYLKVKSGEMNTDEAQKEAIIAVRYLRYSNNDYFWINDLNPIMLMHPMKPEMDGEDISEFQDPNGKYLFREVVRVCNEKGEGFVDYFWPRPDSDKPVPKISYVKLFKPWGWIVGSGIYIDDVEEEIGKMHSKVVIIMLFLSCMALILSYFIAHIINRPLRQVVKGVEQITTGDLTVSIDLENRYDEMGRLRNAFHYMLDMLHDQTQRIIEGTNTLATSISQISTTSTELATSSAETSASISQITTTVEDIRQTAHLSHEKAEQVADNAREATRISEKKRKATEDAITGMNRIREEMEYVAESIVKLSEQTQSIGEIINAVNDLADQSNLLSVNASIEAAKAGEHGKGFAVVAQEVKSLADQSKEATNQVRTILNEIQKATSAAVMATERGSKAVEAGVNMAVRLGDVIGTLSESIMESAKAAMQIAASSQEQLVGMDQLFHEMENIKNASIQNVEGAKQLKSAIQDLNTLASSLKTLNKRFKF